MADQIDDSALQRLALSDVLPKQDAAPAPPTIQDGGNQAALNNVTQAPIQNPNLKESALGGKNMPGIVRLIAGMISPTTQEKSGMSRPPSRMEDFEKFLGNFVGALGAGMANQGTGPASFSRGFGGAMQYPAQREFQQQQLAQQQAQTQLQQAQAQQLQNVVQTPYGPMSQQLASKVFPAAIAAQSKENVAQTAGQFGVQKANIAGQAGIAKAEIAQGIDPKSGQSISGKTLGDFGATGALANLPPTKLNISLWNRAQAAAGKTSTRQMVIQTADGPQVMTLSSTSTPNTPGRRGGGGSIATPTPIIGKDGQPVQPQLTSTTRTMKEAAPKVLEFTSRISQLVDQQAAQLGPAAGRWSEFWAGKVGAPNPEFTKLRTDVNLLQTLLMRMHVGSRGGVEMMNHFREIIDSGKQSPENMKAALEEISAYAQNVQGGGKAPAAGGMVRVQIPGQQPGYVSADKLPDFQKKFPAARVIQ